VTQHPIHTLPPEELRGYARGLRETAALLSISRNTLHRWIRDRVIPWTVKTPGGTRVPGRALEQFMKERAV
jgi:excisionase family DNA binding protein